MISQKDRKWIAILFLSFFYPFAFLFLSVCYLFPIFLRSHSLSINFLSLSYTLSIRLLSFFIPFLSIFYLFPILLRSHSFSILSLFSAPSRPRCDSENSRTTSLSPSATAPRSRQTLMRWHNEHFIEFEPGFASLSCLGAWKENYHSTSSHSPKGVRHFTSTFLRKTDNNI